MQSQTMNSKSLQKLMPLNKLARNLYEAKPYLLQSSTTGRAFGGATLYQALCCALLSIDKCYLLISCRCYFLSAPIPDLPMTFTVLPTSDGSSVASRLITVIQGAKSISTVQALFHKEAIEPPSCYLTYQMRKMPAVLHHSQLRTLRELNFRTELSKFMYLNGEHDVDMKPIDMNRYINFEGNKDSTQLVWIKLRENNGL